jgi:hypothetical protein
MHRAIAFLALVLLGIGLSAGFVIDRSASCKVEETVQSPKAAQANTDVRGQEAIDAKPSVSDSTRDNNGKKHQPQIQDQSKVSWFEKFLCDAKITDVAIAFFTYCLVVVGWFQLSGGEKILRDVERAHVFARISVTASGYAPTVRIRADNSGRGPATLRAIVGKFSAKEPWWYMNLKGADRHDKLDELIAPNEPAHNEIGFPSVISGPQYFFGYIEYQDMFHRLHRSMYCIRIEPGSPLFTMAGSRRLNDFY